MAKRPRCPPNATRGVDGAHSLVSSAMARVSGLARPLDDSLARLAALEFESKAEHRKPGINKDFLGNTIRSVSQHNRREEEADCWRAHEQQKKASRAGRGSEGGMRPLSLRTRSPEGADGPAGALDDCGRFAAELARHEEGGKEGRKQKKEKREKDKEKKEKKDSRRRTHPPRAAHTRGERDKKKQKKKDRKEIGNKPHE
ncbi:hypothetical protein NSK_008430 [Nannochloropsis salina CCMP1776]|uniref:Uncharacterized protein n=1 Tax=Nannochloropsis salina CCMP1776 TaxID=1027361 RepID=A0A4D9CQG9_9STRA|nr:hypothetical protein NSK_008430 [Nannochloropsis salina CCMP1776]|eukprot:TFJ80287.1 hypothetical protein NSK_008430 [Nannochloropsis salina CCMP1776]